MKFKFRRTAWIQTDNEAIRQLLTSQGFERDFLPEIVRKPSTEVAKFPLESSSAVAWHQGSEMDIGLVCKDLNVAIDTIIFKYRQRAGGVLVTIFVVYEKPLEKCFVKAHRAIWSLFSIKLRVLKQDLEADAPGEVATGKVAVV